MAESFTVTADWLHERLDAPGLSIVDASWYLPAQKRDAKAEYDAGHIPGAVFFDHDLVVDPDSDLPHALPKPQLFAQFAGAIPAMERRDADLTAAYEIVAITSDDPDDTSEM